MIEKIMASTLFRRFRALAAALFCLGLAAAPASAQDGGDEGGGGSDFWDRVFIGGNLGLQFGDLTFVDISPLVGYRVTDQLAVGIGGTYIYYRYRDFYGEFKTNIYGGRLFGRYYFIEELFGHVEYEILNLERPDDFNYNQLRRANITSIFVGGGYRQYIGERAALELMALYNLTEEPYSPYSNPIFRVGIVAGF
jgi:hypothetical protein